MNRISRELPKIKELIISFRDEIGLFLYTLWVVLAFGYYGFSAIPYSFTYLSIGHFVGPVFGQVVMYLLVALLAIIPALINRKLNLSLIETKKRAIITISCFILIALLCVFAFSIVLFPQVSEKAKIIDEFVSENSDNNLEDIADNISVFLSQNLLSSYLRPEDAYEIDRYFYRTLLDPTIIKAFNVTRAEVILYQRWGSCGQEADLVQEILFRLGYETRLAHFIGIDHEWAEAYENETWWIINPGYIGNIVEISELRSTKPAFEQAIDVEIMLRDGTRFTDKEAYGY